MYFGDEVSIGREAEKGGFVLFLLFFSKGLIWTVHVIGFVGINVRNTTMEGFATLVRPNGKGLEMDLNVESTTAQDLIDRAELSLEADKPYSFTVTREGEVMPVTDKDLGTFEILPGDELAVTSENKGG
jgi:hypothetical protein